MKNSLLLIFFFFTSFIVHSQDFYKKNLDQAEFNSKKGNYSDAIIFFTKAINISSNDSKAFFGRGFAYEKIGKYSDAVSDYTQAIQVDGYLSAYYCRAMLKCKMKDFRGAKLDYDSTIEKFVISYVSKDKNDFYYKFLSELFTKRAETKLSLKDYNNALIDVDHAISLKSNFGRAYLVKGLCLLQLDDKENACLDFSKAGELGDPEAYNAIRQFCN